jgi:hypothetical protein
MATVTQASQDPLRTIQPLVTPQAKNQIQTPVSAEETVTSTMTVVAADVTPETVTVTAIVIAEDAAEETTIAKKQNQRSHQTTF